MKKVLSLILSLIMIISCFSYVAFAQDEIKIMLNGKALVMDQNPVIVDGRTLVPLRAIFEGLGAEVLWDDTTKTATGIKDGKEIKITINSTVACVDGKNVTLDVGAQILNSRTLVPVRFISESLGCKVDWEANTKTVIIEGENSSNVYKEWTFDNLTSFQNNTDYILGGAYSANCVSVTDKYDANSKGKSLILAERKSQSHRVKFKNVFTKADLGKTFTVEAKILTPDAKGLVMVGMYSDVNTEYAMVPIVSETVTTTQNVWTNVKFTYTHTNEIVTQLGFGQPNQSITIPTIVVDDVKIYEGQSSNTDNNTSDNKSENKVENNDDVLTADRKMIFDDLTEFAHNKEFVAGGNQSISAVVLSNEYDHTSKNGKSLKMGDIQVSTNRVKVLNLLSDADKGKKFKISVWALSPDCDTTIRMGIYSATGTENAFTPVSVTTKDIKKGEWTQITLSYEYDKAGLNQIGFDQSSKNIAKVLYFDDITVIEDNTVDQSEIVGEGAIEIGYDTVKILGRTDKFKDGYPFNWSTSGIEFKFTGKNASVYVSKVSNENQNKYFGVFLDGSKEHKRLKITKKGWYKLFEEDLPDGEHTVKFIRSSEGNNADDGLMLKYVKADNVKPTEAKTRKMEFFGDSYTSGYGNLELGGTKKTAENTDGCLSYAYLTSQLLDADANIESVSGAGATMNYTESSTKSTKNTIPQRVKNSTLVTSTMSETTPWDYSKYTPQVVVVFLGTNDYSGTTPRGNDPEYFKAGYKDFILHLRSVYPNATIIGCSKPSGCYREEAKEVIESLNDAKIIHFTFTKFNDTAVNKHPYYTTDIEMAQELAEKINSIPNIWK